MGFVREYGSIVWHIIMLKNEVLCYRIGSHKQIIFKQYGNRHRMDGPAVVISSGTMFYITFGQIANRSKDEKEGPTSTFDYSMKGSWHVEK